MLEFVPRTTNFVRRKKSFHIVKYETVDEKKPMHEASVFLFGVARVITRYAVNRT